MNFYSFAKVIVKSVFKILYPFESRGSENIPETGPVILCANHLSNLDPIMLGLTCDREIHFMAKEELFHVPVLNRVVRKLHAFPVRRGMADREALRTGLKVLQDGCVLGIFPEGTRSKSGELLKGLSGVGFFALRTDARVIPCAIIGPYRLFRKIRVVYGKPIDMESLKERRAKAEEATEVIMSAIKEILLQYQ